MVTYKFTGAQNCDINISDGLIRELDSDDWNERIFTHSVYSSKEKDPSEDVVVFQYIPKNADGMTLEVIYDDQVAERYDVRSSIYFNPEIESIEEDIEDANEEDVK